MEELLFNNSIQRLGLSEICSDTSQQALYHGFRPIRWTYGDYRD
jgi:hypothetical protein